MSSSSSEGNPQEEEEDWQDSVAGSIDGEKDAGSGSSSEEEEDNDWGLGADGSSSTSSDDSDSGSSSSDSSRSNASGTATATASRSSGGSRSHKRRRGRRRRRARAAAATAAGGQPQPLRRQRSSSYSRKVGQSEGKFLKRTDRRTRRDHTAERRREKRRRREAEAKAGEGGADADADADAPLSPGLRGNKYRRALAVKRAHHQAAMRAARAERKRVLRTKGAFDKFLAALQRRWGRRAWELPPLQGGGQGGGTVLRPLTPVELVRLARAEWGALSPEQKLRYSKTPPSHGAVLLPPVDGGAAQQAPPLQEIDPTAGQHTLEVLCPGCPPRPPANVLALLMRRHSVSLPAAQGMLDGMPRRAAAALGAEVRAAKAEYPALLRVYCSRKPPPPVVGVAGEEEEEVKVVGVKKPKGGGREGLRPPKNPKRARK